MRLIDSHAHLAEERFDVDRPAVLARAAAAGVEAVVVIGYDVGSCGRVVDLVRQQPGAPAPAAPRLYGTVGFAPHNVADATPEARATVKAMLERPGIVAVGEIGLDFHYDMPADAQRDLFYEQLGWAVEADLPVVIHSREAEDDVLRLLERTGVTRGVVHCFTESATMAAAAVERGLCISFSGILTFSSAADLRATAARVPLTHALIETDAPYLAPQRWRGQRNEPAFVVGVAECLAEIHGVTVEEVAAITAANAARLFGLGIEAGR